MKKTCAWMLALLMALLPLSGLAAETWLVRPYEIDDQGEDDLQVSLPADSTTGYEWTCEILDAGIVALAAAKYEADDDFEALGAPEAYEAEFRAVSNGKTRAIFSCARPSEESGPISGVIVDIRADAGQLWADAVYWYEVEEQTELHFHLDANATTGYEWACDLGTEPMLEILSEDYVPDPVTAMRTGSGGAYCIRLAPILQPEGEGEGLTTLTFTYARPWEAESEPARKLIVNVWQTMAGTIYVEEIY